MSVGFSLLCTVFGIPFALTCVKSYYKDNAVLKSVSDTEISSMRKEFLDITGRDDKSSSITKWIEEKHGKELLQNMLEPDPMKRITISESIVSSWFDHTDQIP